MSYGEPRMKRTITRKDRILAAIRRGPCTFRQLADLVDPRIGNLLMELRHAGMITKIDDEWYATDIGRKRG